MAQEINVLIVEAGKAPRPAKVLNTMETFAEIVGGPVEAGCYLPQSVSGQRRSFSCRQPERRQGFKLPFASDD